jgi:hypothetical protein
MTADILRLGMTERHVLQAERDFYAAELRRIDREAAEAAIQRREELQREAEAKARAEREAAEAAHLEQCRQRAWANYYVDRALASGDPSGELFKLMNKPADQFKTDMSGPTDGSWPLGVDVNDFRNFAIASAAAPAEGIADTALGRLLRARGAL